MNLELQLFVGEASDAEARVYAMVERAGFPDDAQLSGELVGPYCRYSQTLPARIRFVDRGPGATLLAEAVVPDPCFWTPELPFMYSAELRFSTSDTGRNATVEPTIVRRPFGIRRLGVQGDSIYVDARRFVVRGIRCEAPTSEQIRAAREAASALYLEAANEQILQAASEDGVLLAVRITDGGVKDNLISQLNRVGRWPATAVVVLDADADADKGLRLAARNTLLAQRVSGTEISARSVSPWAHLIWWELEREPQRIMHPPHNVPIIVFCRGSAMESIAARRQGCDRLQADLAPLADFAGYFV